MSLRLTNSLSRRVETFYPGEGERVTMYVCGPTVYDTPHLGNARPAVVFDTLFRVLRHLFPTRKVQYARNYTDIDDKIMARAAERGISFETLTEGTIAEYEAVTAALGCLPPTFTPRAVESIPGIIVLIERLIERGHAYYSESHVLFDIASDPEHGTLSRHVQEDLRAGARVEPASYKRSPGDFVLWKPSSDDQPGWRSPWGRGRPGWHIECSAMIRDWLGSTIDIHGGGLDLRFPHHECEISQSRCANNAPLSRFFVHNAMVLVDGQKMAKSLGNVVTPRHYLDLGVQGDALRLTLLSAHYTQPLDWTGEALALAETSWGRWRNALLPYKGRIAPEATAASQGLLDALLSDLNTPLAIAEMHKLCARVNAEGASDPSVVAAMMWGAEMLGIFEDLRTPMSAHFLEVQGLIDQRNVARRARDFARADALRSQIEDMGVNIRDDKTDTLWWPA